MNNENTSALAPREPTTPAPIQDTQATAAAAGVRAEIESAYAVAFRYPRDIEEVRAAIVAACSRKRFAETALYSKPVGNNKIRGLSIRAAEEMVRHMRNLRVSVVTTFEDQHLRRLKVTATDLETNAGFSKEATVQKTVERRGNRNGGPPQRETIGERLNVYGDKVWICPATDDELATKEAAIVAKVIRNEALRLIPGDLKEEAIERLLQAERTHGEKAANTDEAHRIIDAFYSLGVKPGSLKAYLGKPIEQITVADLTDLRQVYQGITQEGESWAAYADQRVRERENADAEQTRQTGKGKAPKPPQEPKDPAKMTKAELLDLPKAKAAGCTATMTKPAILEAIATSGPDAKPTTLAPNLVEEAARWNITPAKGETNSTLQKRIHAAMDDEQSRQDAANGQRQSGNLFTD